ncbi:hypothetical protein HZB58_01895 [Candidatus Gottesmanbacteria bacterium]|nr:hypothetical protein [Candidatus Gottesmanbacteria bacterium]
MKLRIAVLIIIAVYFLGFVSHAWHLQKTVYGDGIFYYSWLRSIVVDTDLHFANEYARQGVSQPPAADGRPGNKYSIGPALFWAPAYVGVHRMFRSDGWGLPYQLATGFTSLGAAIAGLILLTKLLRGSPAVTSLALLLTAGATNLLFYGSLDTVNSHALSFFCSVVFLALLAMPKKNWFAVGAALALLASVRLQDMVYVLALIPVWKKIRPAPLAAGFMVFFIPQLTAWYSLYNSLANPYIAGGESFDLLHPHILGTLFSPQSGLFLWTPVTAIGIYGLLTGAKTYRILLLIFAMQLYFIASWSTWWQGASVSGRMFVSTLPLIAVGLADVTKRVYTHALLRSVLPIIVAAFTVINVMGIFYYLFTN